MLPTNKRRTGIAITFKSPNRIESLETRMLLSTSAISASPLLDFTPLTATSSAAPYTPAQIADAYGFNSITLSNGVKGTGAGQTIAIVDAYNDPDISSDLAAFDKQWDLSAPPSLKVEGESGSSSLPANNASWDLEISLDVEWAHAMAPGANILLVEANSSNLGDLLSAVNTARDNSSVSVISMSWGSSEFSSETAYDGYFTTPSGHQGITFVAASGDEGGYYGPEWPATSPNVLSVGGTTLNLANSSGAYGSESAWSGSTGGISSYESEPSYQDIVQLTGRETSPDVSYDANPSTGIYVYDSVPMDGSSGWYEVGGTSAGAPQWAALVAIANQGRAVNHLSTLNGTSQTLPTLFSLYTTTNYNLAYHDITTGNNGVYSAGLYYDAVTGLGSPKANYLVSALDGASASALAKITSSTTSTKTASATASAKDISNKVGFAVAQPTNLSANPPTSTITQSTLLADAARDNTSLTVIGNVPSTQLARTNVSNSFESVHAVGLDAVAFAGNQNLASVASESAGTFSTQKIHDKNANGIDQSGMTALATSGIGIAAESNTRFDDPTQWKKWAGLLGAAIFVGVFDIRSRKQSNGKQISRKIRRKFNSEVLSH
jgi:subtilase family serine protease